MQNVVTNTIVGIGKPISKFIGKPNRMKIKEEAGLENNIFEVGLKSTVKSLESKK
ncbi:MAG: hypothetical protein QMB65_03965 [Vicingaceae bacterium]|jgi:hypothetical protein|tara:strand:- start:4534 stop:4698 length:165 start_codon:yes stop_codon:yes gene_type:complete